MRLSEYGLGGVSDYAALILPRVYRNPPVGAKVGKEVKGTRNHIPLGYVFIIDHQFGDLAKWKMPAGHSQPADFLQDDPPLATAIRELQGETGIRTLAENFCYVGKWLRPAWRDRNGLERPAHWQILFVASIAEEDRDWLNDHEPENEGEVPKFFSQNDFERIVHEGRFMETHQKMLEDHALILLPTGRRVA